MVSSSSEQQDAAATSMEQTSSNNSSSISIGTDILGGLRTRGRYIPMDQKTADSVWGIVHLYRDAQETPYLGNSSSSDNYYPTSLTGSAAARNPNRQQWNNSGNGEEGSSSADEDCTTLCVIAVPSYMSPSDFLGFVGEKTIDDVSHFRMIKTARANRYMVLIRFRSGKKAKEWQRDWNGKVFNSMEVSSSFSSWRASSWCVCCLLIPCSLPAGNVSCRVCQDYRDSSRWLRHAD